MLNAVVVDGRVSELIIEDGGHDYIRPPNIFIDPPETGSDQASAIVTDLSSNSVYKILVTHSGNAYEKPPQVYVQDAIVPDIIQAIRGWDTYPCDNPYSPYRVISSYYLFRYFQKTIPEVCTQDLVLVSGDGCNRWTDSLSLSTLNLIPQNQPPVNFTKGTLYFDNIRNQMGYWNGTSWIFF